MHDIEHQRFQCKVITTHRVSAIIILHNYHIGTIATIMYLLITHSSFLVNNINKVCQMELNFECVVNTVNQPYEKISS